MSILRSGGHEEKNNRRTKNESASQGGPRVTHREASKNKARPPPFTQVHCVVDLCSPCVACGAYISLAHLRQRTRSAKDKGIVCVCPIKRRVSVLLCRGQSVHVAARSGDRGRASSVSLLSSSTPNPRSGVLGADGRQSVIDIGCVLIRASRACSALRVKGPGERNPLIVSIMRRLGSIAGRKLKAYPPRA